MSKNANEEALLREAEDEINLEDSPVPSAESKDGNSETPSLEDAILDCQKVMDLFFNNQFKEALAVCDAYERSSLYHSVGKSFLLFIFGMINLEPPEMKAAKEQVRITQALCETKRRQTSLIESVSSLIWKANYDDYTDEEAHAELVYAELQILHSLLSIFGDQNFVSMIKGAFRMRAANNSYKTCAEIVANKRSWDSDIVRENFESGFLMGNGTLNLILSHLPTRVLKLLTLVGFSGNYDIAIRDLHLVTDEHASTIRYRVAQIVIIIYSLYMEVLFGVGNSPNEEWAESQVNESLSKFPNGAIPLLFAGRLWQMKGFPDKATEYFLRCIDAQSQWKTLKNVCYWDLSWCYAKQCDWINGSIYAMKLKEECNWSPASNMYQYACFLAMEADRLEKKTVEKNSDANHCNTNEPPKVNEETEENDQVTKLRKSVYEAMRSVPELKVRYAGKTIPPEKFAVTKSIRFNSGSDQITPLPALELFCVWNMFSHCSQNSEFLKPHLQLVEAELEKHSKDPDEEGTSLDTYCYLMLLKGVILRYLNQPFDSVDCFMKIMNYQSRIKNDVYLPPHAAVELGLSYARAGKWTEAKSWLEKARTDYSGFLIESLVHIRVHGALMSIQRLESADDAFTNESNQSRRQLGSRRNSSGGRGSSEEERSRSVSRKNSSSSLLGRRTRLSRKSSSASNASDTKL